MLMILMNGILYINDLLGRYPVQRQPVSLFLSNCRGGITKSPYS